MKIHSNFKRGENIYSMLGILSKLLSANIVKNNRLLNTNNLESTVMKECRETSPLKHFSRIQIALHFTIRGLIPFIYKEYVSRFTML